MCIVFYVYAVDYPVDTTYNEMTTARALSSFGDYPF